MMDWVDFIYYFKWYLILIQIFFVFLTALLISSRDFIKKFENKKILIITAHPDDEVMFFTPLINSFKHCQFTLLCLSNGNSAGLGKIREKELENACKFLGINGLEIVNNKSLEDGMDKFWNKEIVAQVITKTIEKSLPDAIFSFDEFGISMHPNHIAIRNGLAHIKTQHKDLIKEIEFWELKSTGIIRKYIGMLDIIFSSRSDSVLFNPSPFLA